jgi:hypothetical protein
MESPEKQQQQQQQQQSLSALEAENQRCQGKPRACVIVMARLTAD